MRYEPESTQIMQMIADFSVERQNQKVEDGLGKD